MQEDRGCFSQTRHEVCFFIFYLVRGILLYLVIFEEVKVDCFSDLARVILNRLSCPYKNGLPELCSLPICTTSYSLLFSSTLVPHVSLEPSALQVTYRAQ